MRKGIKGWLIAAAVLTVTGALTAAGALAAVGFDITKLATVRYNAVTETVTEDFDSVAIEVKTAAITFAAAEGEASVLSFYAPEKVPFTAEVQDRTLVIRTNDKREWYDHFGLSFESPKIEVALPKKAYDALSVASVTGDISVPKDFSFNRLRINSVTSNVTCAANVRDAVAIRVVTGDIALENMSPADMELSATTGDVRLHNITAQKDIAVDTTTGKVCLDKVVAQNRLGISLTTGSIRFDDCDAAAIEAHTVTGSITGTLLSGKTFRTETTTGDISVPPSTAGGACDVSTVTGDITLAVNAKQN